ncbi:hypothetical protein [Hyphomicrobium sp. NDB2Meth4]|uniref:hypothetical protein n=1 Tax=Hyphomicrobium sp. NDB2Meth4 TaxID=1892846 RepID=UPI000A882571|nr:hypothetical protein [Hyphomicrobium sp. NDB2Meth4]
MPEDITKLPTNSRIGVVGEWCLRGGHYNSLLTPRHNQDDQAPEFERLCKAVLVFVDFFATSERDSVHGWITQPEERKGLELIYQLLAVGLLKEIDVDTAAYKVLGYSPGEWPFNDGLPSNVWTFERETFNETKKKVALLNLLINNQHEPLYVGRPLPEYPNYQRFVVWRAVFHEFPLIGDRVPFHDVICYKNEPNTRKLIHRIRQWVAKMQSSINTERELREEISDLLFQYEEHIKHTVGERHPGIVEFLLNEIETIPNRLLTGDWSTLGNMIKYRREYRSDFYRIEKAAPGAELAIILDAKRTFPA